MRGAGGSGHADGDDARTILDADDSGHETAAVLVVYGTPTERLRQSLRRLAGCIRIVVDNSESPAVRAQLAAVCAAEGAVHEDMGGNAGVGAAQNRGVEIAAAGGHDLVLLADDDTQLDRTDVDRLVHALTSRMRSEPRLAAVGPLLVDSRSAEAMYFVWQRNRVKFVRRPAGSVSDDPVDAAFLIASGSLIRLDAYRAVGPFRDDYFIDHIDREWGLRAGVMGWTMLVLPEVRVLHALGDEPETDTRGGVRYRHENALRQYFGSRNSVLLVRDVRLPVVRRVVEACFALYVIVTQWLPSAPVARRQIARGVLDGLRNRRGPARPVGTARDEP